MSQLLFPPVFDFSQGSVNGFCVFVLISEEMCFSLDTDMLFPEQFACLKPKQLPGLVWFGTADHELKPILLWHNTDLALSPE